MKIEIRADGAHIFGYVNVTEKKSRPIFTPKGKVIEEITPGAFKRAIDRAGEITLTVDHDSSRVYARTSDGTLQLYEDDIGLHADVLISDEALIKLAKTGKIRGWSFGMIVVTDEIIYQNDNIPIRKVKDMELDHVTLVINKTPVYKATSVEFRAPDELYSCETKPVCTPDHSYMARALKLKINGIKARRQ